MRISASDETTKTETDNSRINRSGNEGSVCSPRCRCQSPHQRFKLTVDLSPLHAFTLAVPMTFRDPSEIAATQSTFRYAVLEFSLSR